MRGILLALLLLSAPSAAEASASIAIPLEDRHYRMDAVMDGVPIRFMVDTGATITTISAPLAARMGIPCSQRIYANTANGKAPGCLGTAKSLKFGPFEGQNVAVVFGMDSNENLLGMNVLGRFQITQKKNVLTISLGDPDEKQPPPPIAPSPSPEIESHKTDPKSGLFFVPFTGGQRVFYRDIKSGSGPSFRKGQLLRIEMSYYKWQPASDAKPPEISSKSPDLIFRKGDFALGPDRAYPWEVALIDLREGSVREIYVPPGFGKGDPARETQSGYILRVSAKSDKSGERR